MRKKYLILDDDHSRLRWFAIKLGATPDLDLTTTSDHAIRLLKENEYGVVFLDHDLGCEIYVDSERQDTGMEVVRWIEDNKPVIPMVIIQSLNFPAAAMMLDKLWRLGYFAVHLDFSTLKTEDGQAILDNLLSTTQVKDTPLDKPCQDAIVEYGRE